MPSRRDRVRLGHMLDHTREAITLTRGKTRADLDNDRVLNLALVRLLEIVGEAAGRVSKEECALHPEIPWPQITGLRNRSFMDMMRWTMTFFGRLSPTICLRSRKHWRRSW